MGKPATKSGEMQAEGDGVRFSGRPPFMERGITAECSTRSQSRSESPVAQLRSHIRSAPACNRLSPARFDGGPGFSRTRFAVANAPEPSLPLHSLGISQVTDFAARALPPRQRRVDADSENGRDLHQRVSLNFFQQKHVAVALPQPEGAKDQALESARRVRSRSLA